MIEKINNFLILLLDCSNKILAEYIKKITPNKTAPNIYTNDVKFNKKIPIEEPIKAMIKNTI